MRWLWVTIGCVLIILFGVLLMARPTSSRQFVPTATIVQTAGSTRTLQTNAIRPSEWTAPAKRNTHHFKQPIAELTPQELTDFQREFVSKIKPAVEHWCDVYGVHAPFPSQQLTADCLRGKVGIDRNFTDWSFMVGKISVGVCQVQQQVWYVGSVSAPSAALYGQLTHGDAPKPVSVSQEEILKLLEADVGHSFPPNEVAYYPTYNFCSMNGGIMVEAGPDVRANFGPPPVYIITYGPDGTVVSYERRLDSPPSGQQPQEPPAQDPDIAPTP